MTSLSVMPAWKQELIEKKRKKEQEEKVKTQVQNDRSASLPEWKKNLLARKKGLHGADTNHGLDKQSNNIGNNTTVSSYDKLSQKRSSFTTNSTEREHESNLSKNPPKVIVIPKENSQNGTQGGRQHSFVASSSPQSDQQKENKQFDQKLSRNGKENYNNQGIVPEDSENSSKVSYEHIKTPSELRKLFGIVSRDSASITFTESNKTQNQQTQAHKDVSTKPHRSTCTRDYEQSQKSTANTHPQNSSRESMSLKEKEVELPKSQTPAKNEKAKEKDNVIIIPRDNDSQINVCSKDDDKPKSVKDDEIPAEVHVEAIRTKFGPSGNFRLHKSSSSDNLLNSKHQQMSPRSREKPPPLNKRWSADVGGLLSPTRSTSDDEDIFDSGRYDNYMKRVRSKSMGDVKITDHHFQDLEPVLNLKHRASVSSGIEHRLQVLRHNVLVSDGQNDDYEEVDENTNICLDENIKNNFQDAQSKSTSIVGSNGKQMDEDAPKIRKASWFNQEDHTKDTDLLLSHQDYDLNEKPAKKSTISQHSGHDLNKSSKVQEKVKAKHFNSGKKDEAIIDDKGYKQDHSVEVSSSNKEFCAPLKPVPQKNILMNGRTSPGDDEPEKDEKPPKGSVHKLSSLFGSSVSKGNKKAKAKTDNNVTSKSSQEQHLNQENKSKPEKKDSQKSSSSRIFPWSKKQKKFEPVTDVKVEETKPFSGASILRPVHQEVVKQKITGNMTLVINSNAGSYEAKPKQKQPQLNSPNQASGIGHLNSLTAGQNSQVNMSSTKYEQQSNCSPAVRKPDDMMVTVIDVPGPSSTDDVEVSAIDMPGPPSSTPVSVIDIPESPEHDIKVSVIDMPDEEVDSDDSDSSGSCMSGSYDINPVIGSSSVYTINEISREEEEEEEDIDNVPVSYFGDSTYMKVPEVVFESKVENVKSCLSSPLRSRKRKAAKVVFHANSLEKVHDYPSEVCMQYHFDEYMKENDGKTIDQYKPPSLQGLEDKQLENKTVTINKNKVFKSSDNKELKDESNAPTITYLDRGEAFTSSSSSGALLF